MAVRVQYNSVFYEIPTEGDLDWSSSLTDYLVALATAPGSSISLDVVGSEPNNFGATIVSNILALQPADGTHPGVLTAGAQTVGGAKTFTSAITAPNISGTNTGDVTIGTFSTTPNANTLTLAGQQLTAHAADGSNPGMVSIGAQTFGGAKTFANDLTLTTGKLLSSHTVGNAFTLNAPVTPGGYLVSFQNAGTDALVIYTDGSIGFGSGGANAQWSSAGLYTGGAWDLSIAQDGTTTTQIGSNNVVNPGDVAIAVGTQTPDASVNATSKLFQVATGLLGGGVITEKFSVLGNGNGAFVGALAASNLSGTNTGDLTLAAVGSSPSANGASLSGQVLTLQPADGTHPGLVTAATQTIAGLKTFSNDLTFTTGVVNSSVSQGGGPTSTAKAFVLDSPSYTWTGAKLLSVQNNSVEKLYVDKDGNLSCNNFSGTSSGTNTGDVTLAAFGSSPNANGASLSGQALTLQPADGSNPGGVSTTTQTFAGAKTFATDVTLTTGVLRSAVAANSTAFQLSANNTSSTAKTSILKVLNNGTTVADIWQNGIVVPAKAVGMLTTTGVTNVSAYAGRSNFTASTTKTITFNSSTFPLGTTDIVVVMFDTDPGGRYWVDTSTINQFTVNCSASNSAAFRWFVIKDASA